MTVYKLGRGNESDTELATPWPWASEPRKRELPVCGVSLEQPQLTKPVSISYLIWKHIELAAPSPSVQLPSSSELQFPLCKVKLLSRVWLFVIPWTVAYQPPPSLGFSRQEYWGGLPFPSSGDLPDTGFEPGSPALQADALPSEPPGKPYVKWHSDNTCLPGPLPVALQVGWETKELPK